MGHFSRFERGIEEAILLGFRGNTNRPLIPSLKGKWGAHSSLWWLVMKMRGPYVWFPRENQAVVYTDSGGKSREIYACFWEKIDPQETHLFTQASKTSQQWKSIYRPWNHRTGVIGKKAHQSTRKICCTPVSNNPHERGIKISKELRTRACVSPCASTQNETFTGAK